MKINKKILGMNPKSDKMLLPEGYIQEHQPHYKGDGVHNVKELQELCNNFTEYCHQQAIIKSELIKYILEEDDKFKELLKFLAINMYQESPYLSSQPITVVEIKGIIDKIAELRGISENENGKDFNDILDNINK